MLQDGLARVVSTVTECVWTSPGEMALNHVFLHVIECRICAISLIVIFLYCYHGVTLILVSTGPRYPVILGGRGLFDPPSAGGQEWSLID